LILIGLYDRRLSSFFVVLLFAVLVSFLIEKRENR